MPLLIGSIGLIFVYLALNLVIRSRLILETDKEKLKQFGKKLIESSYIFISVGLALLLVGISRPILLQTYVLVGVNLIFVGINAIFLGKPLKEPEANHTTLGKIARLLAQISKWLAVALMIVALVWAAWPIIKGLIRC